jgi:glutamate-1-semialdehyde aminotransferase
MGFGSILFGHNYPPVRKAIEKQLVKSWSVGSISPLAGILSNEISKTTGIARVAFFSIENKSVMAAMCISKTITRKKYIVFFKYLIMAHLMRFFI